MFILECYFAHCSYARLMKKCPDFPVPNNLGVMRLIKHFCKTGSVGNRKQLTKPFIQAAVKLAIVEWHCNVPLHTALENSLFKLGYCTACLKSWKKKKKKPCSILSSTSPETEEHDTGKHLMYHRWFWVLQKRVLWSMAMYSSVM